MTSSALHLGAALDGAGWHPAAWRYPGARPGDLFTAGYWVDLAREAERGLLDFVTIDDSLGLQFERRGVPDDRVDHVRGRLDAVLVASRVAPVTTRIGLIPVVTTTHTEPFHLSKAIATLDYVSHGRAGVQIRAASSALEARLFGRRAIPEVDLSRRGDPVVGQVTADLFDEAADAVEVIRRLWDSWEDDAEIRDVATGRFIDREKLHPIDFEGRWFRVRGPSITPRPVQGQPLVTNLAHAPVSRRLAARQSDAVFITPHDLLELRSIVAAVREAEREAARAASPLRIFVDVVVFLDGAPGAASERKAQLDELDGRAYEPDASVFTGTPEQLADLLVAWRAEGIAGFRLRPGVLPYDLEAVTRQLVPLLQERGSFRTRYGAESLRGRLGLDRPANRYAAAGT